MLTKKSHGKHGTYRAHSKRERGTKNGRQRQNYKNYIHEHKSQKTTVITMKQEVTGSWLNSEGHDTGTSRNPDNQGR